MTNDTMLKMISMTRWTTRVIAAILAGLILFIAVSHILPNLFHLKTPEIMLLVSFTIVFIGLIVGWFNEFRGGIIVLGGFLIFEIIHYTTTHTIATAWMFLVFPVIGISYILNDYITKTISSN